TQAHYDRQHGECPERSPLWAPAQRTARLVVLPPLIQPTTTDPSLTSFLRKYFRQKNSQIQHSGVGGSKKTALDAGAPNCPPADGKILRVVDTWRSIRRKEL